MKQLELDVNKLDLGRNNISKYVKRLSNKFHRRNIKNEIRNDNFSALPNYKQRKCSVFGEY